MLVPHDPSWMEEFVALRDVYVSGLGTRISAVEHVGSTAVPDLWAKPILDIDIVLASAADFSGVRELLVRLGYRHEGDRGIPGREAFRAGDAGAPRHSRRSAWMAHHLYVCPPDNLELSRHLRFRDRLRDRSDLRRAYEELKRSIAARAAGDRRRYARIKDHECRRFVLETVGEVLSPGGAEPCVTHVSRSAHHGFHKTAEASIRLLAGVGVEGDAHAGVTVQHRSRVAVDPTQPNLRQVHLIHAELFDELAQRGFAVAPGKLGENLATRGLDLLGLPTGTRLRLGPEAIVEVTGLRNPCRQIEAWRKGLLAAVIERNPDGSITRKAGIMGVVVAGGEVRPGDEIAVVLPSLPHRRLERV